MSGRVAVRCPRCGTQLAERDERALYLGVSSYATAIVTLHCLTSGCGGRWTWHPNRPAVPAPAHPGPGQKPDRLVR